MHGSSELMDNLHRAQSVNHVISLLTNFARRLNGTYFAYCDIYLNSCFTLSNYPEDYRAIYEFVSTSGELRHFDQVNNAIDPLIHSSELLSEVNHIGCIKFTEHRRNDTFDGALFMVPLGVDRSGVLTLSGQKCVDDLRRPQDQVEAAAIIAILHAKVLYAHKQHRSSLDGRLTPRQAECMSWAADGKTASETATILCISESSVIFHLKQARKRLNAVNLPQAVRFFVESGLLGGGLSSTFDLGSIESRSANLVA